MSDITFKAVMDSEIIKLMIFTFENGRRLTSIREPTLDQINSGFREIIYQLKNKNSVTKEQYVNLYRWLSNEEIDYLRRLSGDFLDRVFAIFTEITKLYWRKINGDLNPHNLAPPKKFPKTEKELNDGINQMNHIKALIIERTKSQNGKLAIQRTNSITGNIDRLKLWGNLIQLILNINDKLLRNAETRNYRVFDGSLPWSDNIIIEIFYDGRKIKHLTLHSNESKDWHGSTHFKKESIQEFDGNDWYNNRLRFNLDDKFKLDYNLDNIENIIIDTLNEDNNLQLILETPVYEKLKKHEEEKEEKKRKRERENDEPVSGPGPKPKPKSPGFENKYLKYKNKYLQLKKIYNANR